MNGGVLGLMMLGLGVFILAGASMVAYPQGKGWLWLSCGGAACSVCAALAWGG